MAHFSAQRLNTRTVRGISQPARPVAARVQAEMAAKKAPLYNRIGDALDIEPKAAVNVVAGKFVDRIMACPDVGHFFNNYPREKHITHIAMFVSMAFGKADGKYSFSKEGVENLTQAHEGLGITPADFDIVASHFGDSLYDAEVPEELAQEAIAIVGGTKDLIVGGRQ